MVIYGPVTASTVPVTTTVFKAAFFTMKLYEDFWDGAFYSFQKTPRKVEDFVMDNFIHLSNSALF